MTKRVDLPIALMGAGVVVGATSVAWWLLVGSVAAMYWSLLVGHLMVLVGFVVRRSRRRLTIAFLLAVLMWWPALFGDLIWA